MFSKACANSQKPSGQDTALSYHTSVLLSKTTIQAALLTLAMSVSNFAVELLFVAGTGGIVPGVTLPKPSWLQCLPLGIST